MARQLWVGAVVFAACLMTSATVVAGPVNALADELLSHLQSTSAGVRFQNGLTVDAFDPITLESTERDARFSQALLSRLDALTLNSLSREERLLARIIRHHLESATQGTEDYWFDFVVTPYSGGGRFNFAQGVLQAQPLKTAADLTHYLRLLEAYAVMIDQAAAKTRAQAERGIRVSKPAISGVVSLFAQLRDIASSALLPARERLTNAPVAQVQEFNQAVRRRIEKRIIPAYAALEGIFNESYRRLALEEVGVGRYPGGLDYYLRRVDAIGVHLTPEQIHELGLRRVRELDAQMQLVRDQLGFKGSREAFHEQLRRDSRFLARTPQEMGDRLMAHAKRMEPHIPAYFSKVPKARYAVKALDGALSQGQTFGFYSNPTPADPVGYYRYNSSDLSNRSLFAAAHLVFHELLPGHHLQLALQLENDDAHPVRRLLGSGAFVEGWAEYAASLGKEMGLYADPYDLYGQLAWESFFAVRLVVDTGMNYFGWPLQQARAYMKAHTLNSDVEIASETLRYSTDLFGQALTFRLGYEKLWQLRHRAEQALGADFDIRRFHTAVIGDGAMPLQVLEEKIDEFIAPAVSQASSKAIRTVIVDRGAQDPAVSPDGKTIAVGLLGKIWLVPVEGGRATQLTFGTAWHAHPAWSPDGRFLAYAYQRPNGTELVVHTRATGTERTLYSTQLTLGPISFHPSGQAIFFIEDRSMFSAHLWRVPTSTYHLQYAGRYSEKDVRGGGEPQQLTFGDKQGERSFAFSPDGHRVALEHVNTPYPSVRDVHVMDLDSLSVERLTDTPHNDESSLSWTRDGTSLVYLDLEAGMEHVTVRSLSDGNTRRVLSSVYDGKQLVLHPDGRTAVMVAGRRLFRVDLSSGRATPIPFKAEFQLPVLDPANLLIVNARLFDARSGGVTERANVAVKDGRIARVWSGVESAMVPPTVPKIDARGRFLMPGLMDNHYHYWRDGLFLGADMLAMGITSIRDPGAPIADSLNLREAIALGLLAGPHLYTLGPLLDGHGWKRTVDVPLTSPQEAASVVRSLHQLGVDGIKIYFSLAPEVSAAVIAEAKRWGLPVTGDINLTTWQQALASGIDGLSHADNYRYGFQPEAQRLRLAEGPRGFWESYKASRDFRVDPRSPDVQAMLRDIAERGVALDPTLVAYLQEDATVVRDGLDDLSMSRQYNADLKALTLDAYRAGVALLAGTDNSKSLHDELEMYERIGVPNAAILQAATVNGARWLRKDREFGTIEVGKRADLLLLDGNPLERMQDIRNIDLVVKDGRVVFSN